MQPNKHYISWGKPPERFRKPAAGVRGSNNRN